MEQGDDREELARRAWRLLMEHGQHRLEAVSREIEDMGLSRVMAQFLGAVCQSPPGPTNQLATRFGVDPAWVTDIVDRLETPRRACPQAFHNRPAGQDPGSDRDRP